MESKRQPGTSKSIVWLLLTALLSMAPWMATLILLNHAQLQAVEGALLVIAVIGCISFASTLPLAALLLSRLLQSHSIGNVALFALLSLVSLPVLSFQAFASSSSIMGIFGPSWTSNLTKINIYHGTYAVLIYAIGAILLYWLAKRGTQSTLVGAILFFLSLLGLTLRGLFM